MGSFHYFVVPLPPRGRLLCAILLRIVGLGFCPMVRGLPRAMLAPELTQPKTPPTDDVDDGEDIEDWEEVQRKQREGEAERQRKEQEILAPKQR